MATTTILEEPPNPIAKPRRVCFSFAAYAKAVIDHLRACHVPVDDPLSDDEFATVESNFRFIFPPDLRSILQEGLPVGPGFPNWRSASPQQLQILTTLPILASPNKSRPTNSGPNLGARSPETPTKPGGKGGRAYRVCCKRRRGPRRRRGGSSSGQIWQRVGTRGGWWSGDLVGCMEEACCRLRDGGWREEEVREMTMMDGGDGSDRTVLRGRESVTWHVRVLSRRLLRAGWSTEDVVDSLGCHCESGGPDVESWLDLSAHKELPSGSYMRYDIMR
ncbi:hypothetical protein Acr_15g0011390 [Actinidia rufa]|uniref:Uncharacterized protein n=1 Tax=Actinidia rufa TaxID=165716 RepID=A0A7J0FV35_9ERIC|nr:hypothetical protein Acr_15g0011390 [Actinidia rufa]